MWKKLITLILSIFIICSLTACSKIPEIIHEAISPASETINDTGKDEASGEKMESSVTGKEEAYILTGTVKETLVIDSEDDIVITLDNVTAKLDESLIKIKNAKSAILVIKGTNTVECGGEETKAIKSNVDLIIEGDGTLNITTTDTCIKSDTNLVVNSGTLNLDGGSEGDGLRSDETLTINGGTISISSGEGLESTQVTINGGTVVITAIDDGINASEKSETLSPSVTINGGTIDITMGQGDTDAIDSNGSLTITGGSINISAQFAFDYETTVTFTGGTVYVNGQKITQITNSMFDGGGFGGGPGGWVENDNNQGGPGSWGKPGSNDPSNGGESQFGGFGPGNYKPGDGSSSQGPGSFGGFPSDGSIPSNGDFGEFPSDGDWPEVPPFGGEWSPDDQNP
ncbi:MAG: carbohydrate-binding domain-containing protein [Oscillospiraceae bacterium]|nr:carbohydrate-binding domain-containing protein [Oscillospiraceae bacterium]